ncbi:MAG: four helix bundle protein [Chloroflexi bacterium]|nr:four helix bundle protein [Chloroflexota bacterium]
MTHEEWIASVPPDIKGDPLWRMEVYQLGLFSSDIGWHDVTKLVQDKRTIKLSDQLYRALGSIDANIAEGYSRSSRKDQVRFYEYALGSAREARVWYYDSRHILSAKVVTHRIQLMTKIIRSLLTIIPKERGHKFKEEQAKYHIQSEVNLLDNPPLP